MEDAYLDSLPGGYDSTVHRVLLEWWPKVDMICYNRVHRAMYLIVVLVRF